MVLESSTAKLLGEYADREGRKNNPIIHNVPERTKPSQNERNKFDKEIIESYTADGLVWPLIVWMCLML